MRSRRARWMGLALAIAVLLAPVRASAQLLDRTSDAVRGRGASSEPRGSAPPRSGGAMRGSRGGVSVSPSAPSPGARPAQPVDATPPPSSRRDRGVAAARTWGPWGGAPIYAPGYGASSSTTIVDAPDVVREPGARDPMIGGSAGVRVVGTIGIAPRERLDAPPPSPGTPVGTRYVVVREEPARMRPVVRGVVSFDAGYVFDETARATLSARIELPPAIDVVLAYAGYLEPNDAGFDAIAIGRLGLGVRLVDEDVARLRLAIAARHFQDWIGPRFGVDALLGMEIDVYEATVLALEGSLGTLGEAFSAQVRASLGVRVMPAFEIYAGYDHLVLQPFDADVRAVELGGPMLGMRVSIE